MDTNMNQVELFRRSCELFNTGDESFDTHYRQAWIRARVILGDKWILTPKEEGQLTPPGGTNEQ